MASGRVLIHDVPWPFIDNGDGSFSLAGVMSIDHTTPGATDKFEAVSNVRRNAGVLHRSGISAADLVAAPAAPTVTARTVAAGDLTNDVYNVRLAAIRLQVGSGNILGVTTVSSAGSDTAAGGANNGLRVTFPAVTNASAYLIFCSTDAAPLLVGYVTEAQRAAGGILTAFGTVGAGGTAGAIDVAHAGTGLASSHAIFAQNTAQLPSVVAGVGAVSCAGYTVAYIHTRVRLSKTVVWAAAPALTIQPWLKSQESSPDWFAATATALSLLGGVNQVLSQVVAVTLNGATSLVVTAPVVTGCTFDVWIELA